MNALTWKRCIGKFFPENSNARKIILIYHAVGNSPWAISENVFLKQIQWLKKQCDIVSLETVLNNDETHNKIQVALTFDDGYACLYQTVFPILQKENVVATIYANTGWIADDESTRKSSDRKLGHYPDESFLTWPEIKKLHEAGWEIGSHGVEHIDLTQEPANVIQHELQQSKLILEQVLQKPCQHFAYTFARNTVAIRDAVAVAGYATAVAGQHRPLALSDDRFRLPRLNIQADYSLIDFQKIILGKWDFLGMIHSLRALKGNFK